MLGLSGVFVAREVRRAHPILWEFREREGETECVCVCVCARVLKDNFQWSSLWEHNGMMAS